MLFSGDVGMIRIDRSYGSSCIVGVFFSFLFFIYNKEEEIWENKKVRLE